MVVFLVLQSDNYMDEDTNSASHDQDGSFDEISIKEENDMDDFSVFVNEEDQKGKEKGKLYDSAIGKLIRFHHS